MIRLSHRGSRALPRALESSAEQRRPQCQGMAPLSSGDAPMRLPASVCCWMDLAVLHASASQVQPTEPKGPKANPFGSAKPVDVSARLKELEERDAARKVSRQTSAAWNRPAKHRESVEAESVCPGRDLRSLHSSTTGSPCRYRRAYE